MDMSPISRVWCKLALYPVLAPVDVFRIMSHNDVRTAWLLFHPAYKTIYSMLVIDNRLKELQDAYRVG